MFRRYFENGLSVIPVKPQGKNPIILEWTKYCFDRPSEKEIDSWESGSFNIGLACGPASNIIALDIDTDDADFKKDLPLSPVIRRGKKGEVRFFKYNPEIKSTSVPFIDILSAGRQVVLPPSIHPDGMAYQWITPDTLENFNPADLPELDLSFMDRITKKPGSLEIKPTGRNNKLVDIVSAMRGRGEPDLAIVREVYEWDLKFHKPRLFTDASERMKAANEEDAKKNAWNFVINVTKSLINLGAIHFNDEKVIIQIDDGQEQKIIEKFKAREYPEPTGLIKDVRDYIIDRSERFMPNIALGGAISFMSAICSNRYRFDTAWANTYVLNLAPTGAGKSFPQNAIMELLDIKLQTKLCGFGNYQSVSAFCKNLKSQRERVDIIDEVSSLFSQMKNGGPWQTAILEEMCKVWSASSTKYMASEYSEKEDTSTCFNPCVNILGSSTIAGIRENINKMMISKGLLPRFLIFTHDSYGEMKDDFINQELLAEIIKKAKVILQAPKNEVKVEGDSDNADLREGPIFDPVNFAPTDQDAINLFRAIKFRYGKRVEEEENEALKSMITRGKEQIMKLALLHAVGNLRPITVLDLEWAQQTFEVCLHNSTAFVQESAVDSEWEKDTQALLNLFKKTGFLTTSKILNRMTRLPDKRVQSLIEHLIKADQIEQVTRENRGRKFLGWQIKVTS